MPVAVIYPKVSLEASSGVISRWLVAAGDPVTEGQILFEIENDKAAVEVESPAAGVIGSLVPEGATVDIGAQVAQILQPDEIGADRPAPIVAQKVLAAVSSAAPPVAVARAATSRPRNPTPLARRIARENGLDLHGLTGTGPYGRVQRDDVLAHLAKLADQVPPRPSDHRTTGNPGRLHAVWLRKGSGLPLVLIHGFSADLNNWRGMLAGARLDAPVLAIDLPAHGRSPREIPDGLGSLAAQIEQTLMAEGIDDCMLVGHSFGAAVATRVAARAAVDVRALLLLSPAGLHPQIDSAFTQGILQARRAESLRPWLELLVHDRKVITDAFVTAVAQARSDERLTAAMAAFAERFFPDGTQINAIRDDLAGLPMPVRVVFGRQDRILPFASTCGLPGHVALHSLNDCGHMPHLEKPGLVLRLLDEMRRAAQ